MTLSRLTLFAGLALLPCTLQDPERKPASPQKARQFDVAQFARLDWLSGTWVIQKGDTTTEEHWRPLRGTTLLGSSHSYDQKRTRSFEHLRIAFDRDRIAYVAMPDGAPPTVFVASKLEDGVVEFENAEHDYPQRIRYEKTETCITATISLIDASRAKQFVFAKK